MKVTRGCHCGQITYAAEVDPGTVRGCHCTDCQRLSGTAFRTNISSLPGTFVLKSGMPKIYIKTAESGNKRAHAFCPECGAPIHSAAPGPNPQPLGYALAVSTSGRNLSRRSGKAGAARPCSGRWT
jgi:hypothetical protein